MNRLLFGAFCRHTKVFSVGAYVFIASHCDMAARPHRHSVRSITRDHIRSDDFGLKDVFMCSVHTVNIWVSNMNFSLLRYHNWRALLIGARHRRLFLLQHQHNQKMCCNEKQTNIRNTKWTVFYVHYDEFWGICVATNLKWFASFFFFWGLLIHWNDFARALE